MQKLIVNKRYRRLTKCVGNHNLSESLEWKTAQKLGNDYLYYAGVYEHQNPENPLHTFSALPYDGGTVKGDFFLPSDVVPIDTDIDEWMPFSIDAVLKGKPVQTRSGEDVKLLHYNRDAEPEDRIIGWIDGKCKSWYENGRYLQSDEHKYDLFMKPEFKTIWVLHYHPLNDERTAKTLITSAFDSKASAEAAESGIRSTGRYIVYGISKLIILND